LAYSSRYQYAIQSIPFDEVAWAAGDGANGEEYGKSNHLEIYVNSDGDYQKAVKNAIHGMLFSKCFKRKSMQ
jgi:N-acetylmuramoyl-L-alanine amidase CwlA